MSDPRLHPLTYTVKIQYPDRSNEYSIWLIHFWGDYATELDSKSRKSEWRFNEIRIRKLYKYQRHHKAALFQYMLYKDICFKTYVNCGRYDRIFIVTNKPNNWNYEKI